jgi:hypothetical protein
MATTPTSIIWSVCVGVTAALISGQVTVQKTCDFISRYRSRQSLMCLSFGASWWFASLFSATAIAQEFRELEVKTKLGFVRGLPISWGADQVLMLRPDGWLTEFPTREVIEHRISDRYFRPAPADEMARQLQTELGPSYQTAIAGPFLIIAPGASLPVWSERFLALYSGFQNYCAIRQIAIRQPPFLMPAIVFRTRQEFDAYSQRNGHTITASTLGYYSLTTNRIALYEFSTADNNSEFFPTASTLIHEATHQTAYNTGIHDRLAEQPLWTIEGLAMLFEAPGVYDSGRYQQPAMRINNTRLLGFRQFFPSEQSVADALPLLVTDDKYFEHDPDRAYCLAWALTYFLSERLDAQYSAYLRSVAARGPGSRYPADERFRQFEASFGQLGIISRDLYNMLK